MSKPATSEKGYALPKWDTGQTGFWVVPDEEENPELRWPFSIGVYQRMRTDGQIASVLKAVTLPIRRTRWTVDSEGCDPSVTRFVADSLGLPVHGDPGSVPGRHKDRFSWAEHLRMALTGLVFGHAFFEQTYRLTGDGRYALHKLAWRPPRTISSVNVASDGGLVSIEQWEGSAPIPVDRLVAYVNEREGGNWLGQSILRPAFKPWILKDRALRVQSMAGERNGLGIPTYTTPEPPDGLSDEKMQTFLNNQIDAGNQLVSDLRAGEDAGAAIPFGAKLTLTGVTGTVPDLGPAIKNYNEEIARSVLAHFLTLGTKTGSWALGTTFADFFTMSLQTVAEWVADVTNLHVIEDLVDINFGTDVPAPRLVFEEIGSQQPATAEAIQSLTQTGVIRPDDELENYVRQRFGLPAVDEATVRAPQGVQAPGDGTGGADDGDVSDSDEPEEGDDGEAVEDDET